MHDAVLIIIDRPEFEKRLAAYLAGRPVGDQIAFLSRHSVQAKHSWPRYRLLQEISKVLQAQADLAVGAMAQQMLVGGGV